MNLKYLKNVSSLKLDRDRCRGCGMCLEVCPHAVFTLENQKAAIVSPDACMECGACQTNCPFDAIEVTAGVGCAQAILTGMIRGTAPSCGCDGSSTTSGCKC